MLVLYILNYQKLLTMLNQNVIFVLSIENHHPIQLLVMQKRPLLMKQSLWIYMEFTKLSNAVIIRSKTVAVKTFLKHWLSLFGVPRKFFSDNGGEFIGDEFYDMRSI